MGCADDLLVGGGRLPVGSLPPEAATRPETDLRFENLGCSSPKNSAAAAMKTGKGASVLGLNRTGRDRDDILRLALVVEVMADEELVLVTPEGADKDGCFVCRPGEDASVVILCLVDSVVDRL